MENCLVTKLKSVVNNPNLDYFDALQITMDWSSYEPSNKRLTLGELFGGPGVKVKILSNGTINGETEAVIPNSGNIKLVPDDASNTTEFLLIGLSKIRNTYFSYGNNGMHMKDPNKLNFCENLVTTSNFPIWYPYPSNSPCDLSNFIASRPDKNTVNVFRPSYPSTLNLTAYPKVSTMSLKDYTSLISLTSIVLPLFGDISYLSNLTAITTINLRHPEIIGNITSLGKMTSMANMNLNDSNVVGTIEDWVAAQCENGRTTASDVNIRSRLVTYDDNGTPTAIGATGKKVSWNKVGDNYNITVASL